MDANLLSTPSVEMSRIEASLQMATAWAAGIHVITPLAMPLSLSHLSGGATSKTNGRASVPRGRGACWCQALSVASDTSSTALVRQFPPDLAGGAVVIFSLL